MILEDTSVAEFQSRGKASEGMVRYAHRNLMMYDSARPPHFELSVDARS